MDPQPVIDFVRARAADIAPAEALSARMLLAAWETAKGTVERVPLPYSQGRLDMARVALICEATRWRTHPDFEQEWVDKIGYALTY